MSGDCSSRCNIRQHTVCLTYLSYLGDGQYSNGVLLRQRLTEYHFVYEEWERRGFEAKLEKFRDSSQDEQDRLMNLTEGSAMRKASKRR